MNQYSRTRARETKPASGAVFQGTGVRKTKAPKGVTVEKRLQEFPAETFCKSAGVLFCRACTREVSLIKQTIVTHVKSEAHEEKKRTYIETRSEDEDVKALLSDYYMAHPDEAQATVLPDTLLFRYRVAEAFMEHGIAFNKLDALRALLERGGETL